MTVSLSDLKAKRAAMTQGEWRMELDRNDQQNIHTDSLWIALLPHQCLTSIEQEQERNAAGIVATHNAADALIEIAEAALDLQTAGKEGDEVIAMMGVASSSDDYSAACTLAPRVEEKRLAALKRLDAALRKVQP